MRVCLRACVRPCVRPPVSQAPLDKAAPKVAGSKKTDIILDAFCLPIGQLAFAKRGRYKKGKIQKRGGYKKGKVLFFSRNSQKSYFLQRHPNGGTCQKCVRAKSRFRLTTSDGFQEKTDSAFSPSNQSIFSARRGGRNNAQP